MRNKLVVLVIATFLLATSAFAKNVFAPAGQMLIDKTSAAFDSLFPGDTVFFNSGEMSQLILRNFVGTPTKKIHFINFGGKLLISNTSSYGVSIRNCRYINFSGNGDSRFNYGIEIHTTVGGALGVGFGSSDVEIEHIEISKSIGPGMLIKTDPSCAFLFTRDKFTQYNTSVHNNYIHNTTTEGIYLGSTFFEGQTFRCNGKDTLVLPHIFDGVAVYENITDSTGWDGIQVASARNATVHHNIIKNNSQAKTASQMNGLIIGNGTTGLVYNNFISKGEGTGILLFSSGQLVAFNNIIIDPGKDNTLVDSRYGIYCDARYALGEQNNINIFNNLIINPREEGIKHIGTEDNLKDTIANNLIINGWNIDDLHIVNLQGKGGFAKSNKSYSNIVQAGFCASGLADYRLCEANELVNQGVYNYIVSEFPDFYNQVRIKGTTIDIGPSEFQSATHVADFDETQTVLISPNPVYEIIFIGAKQLINFSGNKLIITILDDLAKVVLKEKISLNEKGELLLNVALLNQGWYSIVLTNDAGLVRKSSFIKL